MDRARLLILALLCLASTMSFGCVGTSVGPIAGRVVDARTGQGVPGAEVFRSYGATNALAFSGEPSGNTYTPDWVASAPDGTFSFPGRWLWLGGFYVIDSTPYIEWIHPQYGWGGLSKRKIEDSRRIRLEIDRNEQQVRHLADPRVPSGGVSDPCSLPTREASDRCRLVGYGDARRGPL